MEQFRFTLRAALPLREEGVAGQLVNADEHDGGDHERGQRDEYEALSDVGEGTAGHLTALFLYGRIGGPPSGEPPNSRLELR